MRFVAPSNPNADRFADWLQGRDAGAQTQTHTHTMLAGVGEEQKKEEEAPAAYVDTIRIG